MGLLRTLRQKLAVHRRHLLEHELQREQDAASHDDDQPPSPGLAGPILGGPVGAVPTENPESPQPLVDDDGVQRP